MLTHVEKSPEDRKQEKLLLEDSSLDTSTDNNTDIGQSLFTVFIVWENRLFHYIWRTYAGF